MRDFLLLTVLSLARVYSEITSTSSAASGQSDSIFSNFLFPTEHIPDRPARRTHEWYRDFKHFTPIANDSGMTATGQITLSSSLVGADYTVSAILPGTSSDNIYILRRRQDPDNRVSEFSADGSYVRLNEGAIVVNCILHLNITSSTLISSSGNNTFYYPNAMVRDPQGNFWFSDAARHQVLRMNPGTAAPDVVIGEQFASGKGTSRLCAPNDVAVTSRHVYVADGRCNDRVVLFNKTGGYIADFGVAPSRDMFSDSLYEIPMRYIKNPRALAVDEQTDRLYIAESERSRVVMVKAGGSNESTFGTEIRYFHHPQIRPYVECMALHPEMPYVFVLNSFNTVFLHRGFTFNTHDASFKGAWGPALRGFVRPRAISVTADGSTVYVADATEETPEKIWIFTSAEYLRSRRNVRLMRSQRHKGHQDRHSAKDSNLNRVNYNMPRALHASTKGSSQLGTANRIYPSVFGIFSSQRTKGRS